MALTAVSILDSDAPIPYMLPKPVPAALAVSATGNIGFTFTNKRTGQDAGDVTPVYVTIVGDAAWSWCHLDQAGQVPVGNSQPLTFPVGTTPVTLYCRSAAGANLYAFVAAKATPPSTF